MLEVKNISKTYRPKKGIAVQALKNINLTFPNVGMVFLLGKSGCGKSTLLHMLGGLDSYDKGGELVIDGKSTRDFKMKDFDDFRNRYVGFVFQEFHLLENLTVIENVNFALELQGRKKEIHSAEAILKEVGIEDCSGRRVLELSGGQKQRVAIARALVKTPKVILADEPTGNLDSLTEVQIMELLKSFSKDILVIVVTHDRDSAFRFGDRVIELADGVVISDMMVEKTAEKEVETMSSK